MIFSANYFGMDEDAGTLDCERILDRVAAIPFVEWEDMPANEFAANQKRFKLVVDNPDKPTELLIGEIGDFIRSTQFAEKRDKFANLLYEKTDECIKMRTLLTNYSSFYAILWKFHQIFENVWGEMHESWDGFMDWVESVHVPFLKKQHQEKDHSKHSIRRFIMEVLSYTLDWSILERRKILKICETSKLTNGTRFCLAFHPSPRYLDFQEMGGVRLKDLKAHTNAVGGAWGEDTWAALVKDNCDAVFDNTEDGTAGLEDTKAKRALLIPVSVFTSSHIMRIATLTGQSEDYKKFGVDEETPSGVEDIRNSTQRTGSSLHLVLSDVSSIREREDDNNEEIVFDELQDREQENFLEETNDREDQEIDNEADNEDTIAEEETIVSEHDGSIDFNISVSKKKPNLRKNMKAKNSRNITVIEKPDKTFFVCDCGYSSTSKSGSSRHKCRKAADVSFPCKECEKVCRNPGSLQRHVNSVHKQSESLRSTENFTCEECDDIFVSEGALGCHKMTKHKHSTSLPTPAKTKDNSFTCAPCGKKYGSKRTLDAHMKSVHVTHESVIENTADATIADATGIATEDLLPTRFPCSICAKTYKTEKILKKHMKLHRDSGPASSQDLCKVLSV